MRTGNTVDVEKLVERCEGYLTPEQEFVSDWCEHCGTFLGDGSGCCEECVAVIGEEAATHA